MTRTQHRRGEEPYTSDPRRSSVMSISAILNNSDGDPEKLPRINAHQAQQAASYTNNLPARSRTNPSPQETPPYFFSPFTRSRAGSTSTQSSEGTASRRRANRPKYSEEEEAFIWFHRVDLRQEWDTIAHAFNQQFRHSHVRHKSGLECKLYRVLDAHRVPQIRAWRKRGNPGVEAIPYYGIIELTNIRYPWMGPRYWPPPQW